ncbi:hypothetical protein DL240_10955 [Lujinxingia litoralis]|uniref:Endonuclease MutS2 n=1 Tax=Lujinxingia litoralis TaxID=2211119 RepID=A0A328C7H9_9DELT|nr:endonuclease MutS2 [Lujinxingia litoralis]RAL22360.1 hypothetical protein DL240_10955 [Lujinxingia litoralis]
MTSENAARPTSATLASDAILDQLPASAARLLRTTLRPLIEEPDDRLRDIPQKSLRDLQWDQLLAELHKLARTPEGQFLIEELRPLPSRELVNQRLAETAELMALLENDDAPPLGGLREIRRALQHVSRQGSLRAEDLEAISRNCDVAARVARYFQSRTDVLPNLGLIGMQVDPLSDLRATLTHAIEPGGRLSDHASPDLGRLRRAVQNHQDRIASRVDQLLKSRELDHALRDDYVTVREDRYVIPIRAGARGHVPGIVHDYSASGQTLFIEPTELVELNNQLRWAQIELADEEERILKRLSALVASHASTLFCNVELLAYLDLVQACARQGRILRATVPRLTDGELELRQARHPLLFLKLRQELPDGRIDNDTVPNDIAITPPRRVLIVSGPNTGGKTVSLKTTGLLAIMVRHGLPIPVDEGSAIPLFEQIFTDVGDEQSIERDLSTFSGHVTNINTFLDRCGPRSLVLLDELFVGTDPMQGAALAVALLENLANRGATCVVTTHLEGLKTLAYQSEHFANASMGFDVETLSPTYQMTMGIPGSSFAVRIASRLGMAQPLIDRALGILEGQDHHSVEEVLESLEDQVRELHLEKDRLRQTRQEAETRATRYKKKYAELLQKDRDQLFGETRKLRADLRQARDRIREELKELKRQKTVEAGKHTEQQLQAMQDRLKQAEDTIEKAQEKTRPPRSGPEGLSPVTPDEIEEGMSVYCRPFKRAGQVLKYSPGDSQAQVQLGDLKVNVKTTDLYHVSESQRRDHRRGRRAAVSSGTTTTSADEVMLLPQTSDNSVDLRGMRADEALDKLELFLDSAYLRNISGVYIIHGHGTGALKRAVRGHLPRSRYVRDFRRGEREEGGDGVTIAFVHQGG